MIKQLSINSETLDISNIPKLNSTNTFKEKNIFENDIIQDSLVKHNRNCYILFNGFDSYSTPQNNKNVFICTTNNSDVAMEAISQHISLFHNSTGENGVQLLARQTNDRDHAFSKSMGIYYNYPANKFGSYTLHPETNSNNDSIATTYWVRSLLQRNGINLTS